MSDIEAPSKIPLKSGEGTTRVIRTSTTSDDSSAQQKSAEKKHPAPEKSQEIKEKSAAHETAVTIASSLSNLKVGSHIIAKYLGVDGEGRPLIAAESGTYLVRNKADLKAKIDKIPTDAKLDVKILKVDREIEARIIYSNPKSPKTEKSPVSIPVTLELTGLGDKPPKVRPQTDDNSLRQERQKISYQATSLYQASNIARHSANRLDELPLPATTTNYTLYERAIPNPNRPTVSQSSIAGNALIAQEQLTSEPAQKTIPLTAHGLENQIKNSVPDATAITKNRHAAAVNVEKLLHHNIFATVIKTIPKVHLDLPDYVLKQIGDTGPLDNLKAGTGFTLQINAIAIPEPGPVTGTPAVKNAPLIADQSHAFEGAADGRVNKQETIPVPPTSQAIISDKSPVSARPEIISKPIETLPSKTIVQEFAKSTDGQQKTPENSQPALASPPQSGPDNIRNPLDELKGISGIIIAPAQTILKNSETEPPLNQRPNSRYADRYYSSPPKQSVQDNEYKTLYVATPVSVIKFRSPIELTPGTIINFSLPITMDTQANIKAEQNSLDQPQAKTAPVATVFSGITAAENSPKSPQSMPATGETTAPPVSAVPSRLPADFIPGIFQESSVTVPLQPLDDFFQDWQSISQIMSVISTLGDSSINQALLSRMPGAENPGQMTSTMVFFLAAMGAKNPAQTFLGPHISQQLEKAGHANLLKTLDKDMQRVFRLGSHVPVNEWRPAMIPLHVGGDVTAIPILTRQISDEESNHQKGSDDDEKKITATRFIVELNLKQLGQIQVDGLLKENKLNIIIRSKIILPEDMKNNLSRMFTTALEISGFTGDLQFRGNASPDVSVRNIINQKIHMLKP